MSRQYVTLLGRWSQRLLFGMIALSAVAAAVPYAALAEQSPPVREPAELLRFVEMRQDYDISFLLFRRVAAGKMTFQRDGIPGRYRAVLEARTLGTAAWLTGNRVQRYETVMEWAPSGRFRPLEHRSHVEKGKDGDRTIQTKLYRFDDRNRTVSVVRLKDGAESAARTIRLSATELPDDFLTAFFNFVLGVYGEVRVGGEYRIPTLTRQGSSTIEVSVLSDDQRPSSSFFPAGGRLLKIILDPEVLDTGGGAVYARLTAEGRLERGIVENVLGLGDVKGILR